MLKKGAILPENKKKIEKHSPVYILTEKEFKELAGDWKDKYEESEYKRICAEVAHIDELNELRNQIQELKSKLSNQEKQTWDCNVYDTKEGKFVTKKVPIGHASAL